jgi:hypothetical protein
MVSVVTCAGSTVRVTVWELEPTDAEIPAAVLVETALVAIANVAEDAPDGTVKVAGTVAEALLEARDTVTPVLPAVPFSVTVPVALLPPKTDVGLTVTAETPIGFTVKLAALLAPFKVPVIVTTVVADTLLVLTANVAEVAPAATTTEAGTVADAELEVSVTVAPPLAAGPFNVTDPVLG